MTCAVDHLGECHGGWVFELRSIERRRPGLNGGPERVYLETQEFASPCPTCRPDHRAEVLGRRGGRPAPARLPEDRPRRDRTGDYA